MRIEQWIRKLRLLGVLLPGLLLFAMLFLTSETANASPAKVQPQKVQLESVSMSTAHDGWAVEKNRTRVFHTNSGLLQWKNVTPAGLHLPGNDDLNAITTYYKFFTATQGIAIDKADDGTQTLFLTNDAGQHWSALHPSVS